MKKNIIKLQERAQQESESNKIPLKDKVLLDIKGLCELYSFNENGVRDMIRHGKIPIRRIGRKIRFHVHDIEKWLERKKVNLRMRRESVSR